MRVLRPEKFFGSLVFLSGLLPGACLFLTGNGAAPERGSGQFEAACLKGSCWYHRKGTLELFKIADRETYLLSFGDEVLTLGYGSQLILRSLSNAGSFIVRNSSIFTLYEGMKSVDIGGQFVKALDMSGDAGAGPEGPKSTAPPVASAAAAKDENAEKKEAPLVAESKSQGGSGALVDVDQVTVYLGQRKITWKSPSPKKIFVAKKLPVTLGVAFETEFSSDSHAAELEQELLHWRLLRVVDKKQVEKVEDFDVKVVRAADGQKLVFFGEAQFAQIGVYALQPKGFSGELSELVQFEVIESKNYLQRIQSLLQGGGDLKGDKFELLDH